MSRILGIDEAGKGCIIGPLVIGAVICSEEEQLARLGVKDSKVIKKDQREALFEDIPMCVEAYDLVHVSVSEIDAALAHPSTNLNLLEAEHIAHLINKHKPDVAIIDCPSPNIRAYQEYIYERLKHKTTMLKCAHRADASYDVVAAASIMAKVTRDRVIEDIKKEVGVDFGSGYLSDEKTRAFLKEHWKTYAAHFRKSWKPYRDIVHDQSQTTLGNF